MAKPSLLDLYCKAGGAGKGYQLAGFHVTGVDINPQPRYCGDEFYQADVMELTPSALTGFDMVHASPPCQHYANVTRWRGDQEQHPDLIGPTRELLIASGLPYVIENVRQRVLRHPVRLCGTQFGLPIQRHRYFEANFPLEWFREPCQHRPTDLPFMHKGERRYADAMGCTWMTSHEGREAIPPAYAEWIGRQLLAYLEAAA